MSFTGIVFWNLIKTTCGQVFNVNFGQDFQGSHQIDVPYRNGTRNLRRRDVCAPEKKLRVTKGWYIEHL